MKTFAKTVALQLHQIIIIIKIQIFTFDLKFNKTLNYFQIKFALCFFTNFFGKTYQGHFLYVKSIAVSIKKSKLSIAPTNFTLVKKKQVNKKTFFRCDRNQSLNFSGKTPQNTFHIVK